MRNIDELMRFMRAAAGETVDWIYTDGWLAETIADEGGPL